MKKPIKKSIISSLFVASIISGVSCANEDNNAPTSTQISDASIHSTASTVVALNTEIPTDDIQSHGEEAHNNHCYKCHTDEVYTRDNRFVKSIDALSKQVVRCKGNTEAAWFDEDAEAVVQFLNQKYYKF